jgi:hypothetical protein
VHIANKCTLLVMACKTKIRVHVERDTVLVVYVQHANSGAEFGEMLQACHSERSTEASACKIGFNGNDINFSQNGLRFEMEFRPAKSGQLVVNVMKQKAIWAKPGFLLSRLKNLFCPSTLLGMVAKCTVVYIEP